jgi:aminoglycoside 6'-N-acetyltransferase
MTDSTFKPLRLETPRLILRHFRPSDLATLLAYRNDPEVARYQSWSGMTEANAAAFVAEQAKQPVAVAAAWLQIAIERKEAGEHIGDLALKTDGQGQAEIGYSLSRSFQGQGYASEAVRALHDYLFAELALHRVVAVADVRNVRSTRLLERVGMRCEGHFIESFWFKGEWTDEYLYAILAREWPSVRG